MNVEFARTFLAVVDSGSFIEAANRVYVTQSTVSTRIKALEERLGKVLFERGKGGASTDPCRRSVSKTRPGYGSCLGACPVGNFLAGRI